MRPFKPLSPLLALLVFGCSQNPHVDISSPQPVRQAPAAQRTPDQPAVTPANPPANPPVVDVDPTPVPPPQPDFVSPDDRDGDYVPDDEDNCPDVPGQVANDGCPLDQPIADRDRDFVPDIYDKCPDVPGQVANDGCPLEGPAVFPPPAGPACPYPNGDDEWRRVVREMKESLKFDFDRYVIKPESYPALRHLQAFMQRYPLAHVYMVGHTDDVGSDSYNLWLSSMRVHAVKDFLVQAGIAGRRISLDARGEREPLVSVEGLDDRRLDRARAMNRRVDLSVRYEELVH
jgi:outer membrane protein OmpA-like peptidoglycan-associated protein